MNKLDYKIQAELLVKVIDIAIECFKNNPPVEFEESHINQFVNTYLDFKNKAINPEPRFNNIKSLNQIKNDVLIYFQEGTGNAVNAFWKKISLNNIDIKRTNKLEKILKRGKIKNQTEFDNVIDLYNSYIESNSISQEDILKINNLISEFEKSK
jgi:hypothetical protein